MLRTEWRVLFHLWRYGDLTAREICDRASLHKTKVSRAVRALEDKRMLRRTELPNDRRNELLSLTPVGRRASEDLTRAAADYDARLLARFTPTEQQVLQKCLKQIADQA
jgi:DNA-binding MarR family transcriptional regulator